MLVSFCGGEEIFKYDRRSKNHDRKDKCKILVYKNIILTEEMDVTATLPGSIPPIGPEPWARGAHMLPPRCLICTAPHLTWAAPYLCCQACLWYPSTLTLLAFAQMPHLNEIFLNPSFLHEKSSPSSLSPYNILHKKWSKLWLCHFLAAWPWTGPHLPKPLRPCPLMATICQMDKCVMSMKRESLVPGAYCVITARTSVFAAAQRVVVLPNSLLGWGDPQISCFYKHKRVFWSGMEENLATGISKLFFCTKCQNQALKCNTSTPGRKEKNTYTYTQPHFLWGEGCCCW